MRNQGESTYLEDLPSTGSLVIQLGVDARDDGAVRALLHPVFSSGSYLARFDISETEDFLRGESHEEDGHFVFEDLAHAYLRELAGKNIESGEMADTMRRLERDELTSTCRMSMTLLSLMSPCLRYCSIVAQRTLYVWFTNRPHKALEWR